MSDLELFLRVIVRALLVTGIGPGILLAFMGRAARKFWCPVAIGHVYRVIGYHTGDFVGEVERADASVALFLVRDPLRTIPKVTDRCSFPQCVGEEFHDGDHRFEPVRAGAQLLVYWRNAKFEEVA